MQRFIAILFCLLVTEPAFAATSVQDLQQLISQQRYATATPNGEQVMQLLSTWLADWESLDHERYRRHYSRVELDAYGSDFKSWVNRNKTWIDVEYSRLNIFNYPGEENLMLMQFEQSYRSNNLNVDSPKELYRRNTEANWHIVYEGNRTFPAPDTAIVDN
jgi:hypothetical protein